MSTDNGNKINNASCFFFNTQIIAPRKEKTNISLYSANSDNFHNFNKMAKETKKKHDTKWYILSTYSGHEKKVANQIKQRVREVSHTFRTAYVE